MGLYDGVKTRVSANSEFSVDFEVKVWIYQLFVLSLFIFEVVVDVVTELSCVGVLSDLLYANDFV